jgi:hypothetical protein
MYKEYFNTKTTIDKAKEIFDKSKRLETDVLEELFELEQLVDII